MSEPMTMKDTEEALKRVKQQRYGDPVNHPKHYTSHPSGIECIQVTEHFDFCTGSAMKYLWRAGLKQNKREDLEKAKWYIERLLANEDYPRLFP